MKAEKFHFHLEPELFGRKIRVEKFHGHLDL